MSDKDEKTGIILIRHTNTGFHGVYFLGRADVPITEDGIKHAKEMGQLLKDVKIDKIYSSCLKRSIMTAEEIAKLHEMEVEHMEDFNELDFGVMDGLTGEEVEKRYPGLIEKKKNQKESFIPPEGESREDARKRVMPAFRELFEKHKGETVVVVMHSIIMRIIFKEITEKDIFEIGHIGFGCRMYYEKDSDGEIKFVKIENDREYEGIK